jgi:type II secretory pathway pseudopilin PulG
MSDCVHARRSRRQCKGERGLVLLTLLIALMLVSAALLGALDVWALQRQRLQEEELLFVGNQYRLAIQHYYRVGRVLPMSVDDLLEDKRFPVPMHHLRRAYPDPITGKNDWLFLKQGDRIFGVYSSSVAPPVKHANFPRRYADFADAKTYGDWQFFYRPPGTRRRPIDSLPGSPTPTGRSGKPGQPGNLTSGSPYGLNDQF